MEHRLQSPADLYLDRILSFARDEPSARAIGNVDGQWLNRGALARQISYIQRALRGAGIARQDKVACVLPNGPDCATAMLGVSSTAIYAPLNSTSPGDELAAMLRALAADALLGPARYGDLARLLGLRHVVVEARPDAAPGEFDVAGFPRAADISWPDTPRDPEAIAWILHTSGTTGRSRRVLMPHRMLSYPAASFEQYYNLTASDSTLVVSPLTHTLGLFAGVLAALYSGGSTVVAPGFEHTFLDWWQQCRPTWFSAVPFVYQTIIERAGTSSESLHRPRLLRSAAAPLPSGIARATERLFGCPLVQTYALTEAVGLAASGPAAGQRKDGSCGRAMHGQVAILGSGGVACEPFETGEIVTRGPHVTPGYERNPEANQAAFIEGWLRTGDEGYLDADGFLFVTGRIKDIINRGGEKVMPLEIDHSLAGHPDVHEALAFAIPSDRLGEDVAVAVVLRKGALENAGELQQFLADRLAPYKVPRSIVFVDKIPRNANGKPDRNACRSIASAQPDSWIDSLAAIYRATREEPATATPVERTLGRIWGGLLGVGGVFDPDTSFFDTGGDSLRFHSLLRLAGEALGVDPPAAAILWRTPTIRKLATFLEAASVNRRSTRTGCFDIDPSGHGKPIVWIGPDLLEGNVCRELRGWRPMYGLEVPARLWTEGPESSIENGAGFCKKALERRFGRREVTLIGWCFAGVLGFEIARQLRMDLDVRHEVVIIDGHDVLASGRTVERLSRNLDRVAFHLQHAGKASLREAGAYLTATVRRSVGSSAGAASTLDAGFMSRRRALRAYRPQTYDGDVLHVMAEDRPRGRYRDPEAVWGPHVTGAHHWCESPGSHVSMFQPPNSAHLASILRRELAAGSRVAPNHTVLC